MYIYSYHDVGRAIGYPGTPVSISAAISKFVNRNPELKDFIRWAYVPGERKLKRFSREGVRKALEIRGQERIYSYLKPDLEWTAKMLGETQDAPQVIEELPQVIVPEYNSYEEEYDGYDVSDISGIGGFVTDHLFGDIRIQAVESNGVVGIPLEVVGKALGYSEPRRSVHNLLARKDVLNDPKFTTVTAMVTVDGKERKIISLTELGLVFVGGVSEMPAAIPFQKWASEVVYKELTQQVALPAQTVVSVQSDSSELEKHMIMAYNAIGITGKQVEEVRQQFFNLNETKADKSEVRLLAETKADKEDVKTLIAEAIAEAKIQTIQNMEGIEAVVRSSADKILVDRANHEASMKDYKAFIKKALSDREQSLVRTVTQRILKSMGLSDPSLPGWQKTYKEECKPIYRSVRNYVRGKVGKQQGEDRKEWDVSDFKIAHSALDGHESGCYDVNTRHILDEAYLKFQEKEKARGQLTYSKI